jgi:lipopolysaccharide transport system permease protein
MTVTVSTKRESASVIKDFAESILSWRLWTLLGWLEVRQRYSRSSLGPFWLTISMAVMIASVGLVYGALFHMNLSEYLPFLSAGIIMWSLFSTITSDGSMAYINSATFIRQAATPKLLFILQVVWRNSVIFAHNIIIVVVLLAIFGVKSWIALLYFLPALLIYLINAAWVATLVSLVSARFRDLPQVIAALLQVAFYVTPIMYRPTALKQYAWIVKWNPLSYLLDLVRGPLTGEIPAPMTWIVSCALALVGWPIALWVTNRYLKRIPYWV